ncbi:MAG: hypothetical protein WC783_02685 [Candidatus Paceibacterota bacterium]|jgi:hypothetical protein
MTNWDKYLEQQLKDSEIKQHFDEIFKQINEAYAKLDPKDRNEIDEWDCTNLDGLEDYDSVPPKKTFKINVKVKKTFKKYKK